MIKEKMEQALNAQINEEMFSAYLYLSMSAHCQRSGLPGFANWMHVQYQEEMAHAMKLFNYINERGGKVVLKAIGAPKVEWASMTQIFEETLKHEGHITECINKLVDLSTSERDHATTQFLQWYVNEQVEEESNASQILDQLKMLDGSKQGLFFIDRELATRVFVDPTAKTTTGA